MRKCKTHRETTETNVSVELNLDESAASDINTQIPFLNHMLDLASRHGHFTLKINATGDTDVDYHHLMEDIGITLGDAINKALGDKHGISRYGAASVPMDESLAEVVIDLSGRPYLVYNVKDTSGYLKDLQVSLFEDFFRGLSSHGLFNLHIMLHYGRDTHHIYEAIFKAFGRALSAAAAINPKTKGVPSTKGTL
ncbi:imidazoleglycerol-phosphate dehydratase HisB [Candidatus Magnetominusculus xianensis]|uniref:Imidazoleglycerol-phosphate dehydratase n=1 Tax=Candidatus Magnetominusculus xianensis TaxID=1748249 RepID=A0ABR5SIG3_9BACT|nr:imidazoleglycerol-phosphate dehydratase HisB [Candidatus Magnetominusculus xianensis]KWT88506.1 imidazoleglycerol-phosphate dehydratase [Candidatus Magnetominusculus xianensis]MBF0404421.1 imidazoleglycerol-phosphate dehydratase HisB [Nitrospirota bacterium]